MIQLNPPIRRLLSPVLRILVDIHEVEWAKARELTRATFCHQPHAAAGGAETWLVLLMERLLPHHMQIIYLINGLQLDEIKKKGEADGGFLLGAVDHRRAGASRVRMGHLAYLGSQGQRRSGAALDLMKVTVFRDSTRPIRNRIVNNKTNGITFRRWLYQSNPKLTGLIGE